MTRDEALRLQEELSALAGRGPGANPDGRLRLNEILWQFDHDDDCDGCIRGKASAVASLLDPWLRDKAWRQWGDDPRELRGLIGNSLAKLRIAIGQCLSEGHA